MIPKCVLCIALFFVCSATATSQDATAQFTNYTTNMNSFIAIFEIPATDISRAVSFYQGILEINIEEMEFPGTQMGLFPLENQSNVGVLLKAQDYVPSANGVTIYFNAGDDLQLVLDKVEALGGSIITPKTAHADGVGFFALFFDSEGNRMGLHSPN